MSFTLSFYITSALGLLGIIHRSGNALALVFVSCVIFFHLFFRYYFGKGIDSNFLNYYNEKFKNQHKLISFLGFLITITAFIIAIISSGYIY